MRRLYLPIMHDHVQLIIKSHRSEITTCRCLRAGKIVGDGLYPRITELTMSRNPTAIPINCIPSLSLRPISNVGNTALAQNVCIIHVSSSGITIIMLADLTSTRRVWPDVEVNGRVGGGLVPSRPEVLYIHFDFPTAPSYACGSEKVS